MYRIRSFSIRLLNLFRRPKLERDLSEQLEAHREMIKADLIRHGMDPSQAEFSAKQAIGNDTMVRELSRDEMVHKVIDEGIRDIRHGLRGLARNAGFTVVATASLAIGIGANTFIFSLINSTLLNPLGYPQPERLVAIWTVPRQNLAQTGSSSVSTYFPLRELSRSFEDLGAFNGGACGIRSLGGEGTGTPAERIYGQCFTPSLFRLLGMQPFIGRTFVESEDQIGKVAPVVLLSYGLWQARFGGNPGVIGQTITLNQVPTTVIGVLRPDFNLFRDTNIPNASRSPEIQFVAPLELGPTQVNSRIGGNTIVGRLKAGVSIAQAQSEIDGIAAQLAVTDPVRHEGLGVRIESLQQVIHRDYRSPLLLLQGAVGFVLLISCANVAGLLLARMATRRNEVGLRVALGASRGRVMRQLAAESLPLVIAGGALGVFVAWAGLQLFVKLVPKDFSRLDRATLDGRVLGFTVLVVLAASVLFALVPALQAARARIIDPLRESTRTATGSTHRQRLRSLLVTGQVALALVLLIGAGLMINSFIRVVKNDLGAETTGLLTFDYHLPPAETINAIGMYRGIGLAEVRPKPALMVESILEKLQNTPAVLSAAAVSSPPFGGIAIPSPFVIEGRPAPPPGNSGVGGGQPQQSANYFSVTRGYFGLMKTPVLKGREFDAHDTSDSHLVILINETMARQFFPNEDPIGKRIRFDLVPDEAPREIVGVVGDNAIGPMQANPSPAIFVPHLQQAKQWLAPSWGLRAGMYFVLRTREEPSRVISAVKMAVAEVDRNTPAAGLTTVEQVLDQQTQTLRMYMFLLGIFAVVAALLAATGIYGVLAYSVAERTREIGIRMALGGRTPNILAMVLREAGWIVGVGLTVGLAGAFALSRLLQSLLFGVTATDVTTYGAISLLLLLISIVACLIPARRAATVDPVLALKHE